MTSYLQYMDSSSSSDEDRQAWTSTEMHFKKGCGYTKHKVQSQGRTVYLWIRTCECGRYTSYQKQVTNLYPEDGKDVHDSSECCWKKKKRDGGKQLLRKCVCSGPTAASNIGDHALDSTTQSFPKYSKQVSKKMSRKNKKESRKGKDPQPKWPKLSSLTRLSKVEDDNESLNDDLPLAELAQAERVSYFRPVTQDAAPDHPPRAQEQEQPSQASPSPPSSHPASEAEEKVAQASPGPMYQHIG